MQYLRSSEVDTQPQRLRGETHTSTATPRQFIVGTSLPLPCLVDCLKPCVAHMTSIFSLDQLSQMPSHHKTCKAIARQALHPC
mmetsp:Transcript_148649/g.477297  ORF Transcript_148649/g.477297 Transcript_148649/m.477297 type:complete len:83 (-) Transcript_148649:275-523(-)